MSDEARRLYLTATHEAGHAVAAFLSGHVIELVTLEPSDRALGHCRRDLDDLETPDQGIRIALAGAAAARAEANADVTTGFLDDGEGGSPDREGTDEWQAWLYASMFARADQEARAYLTYARSAIDRWVREWDFARLVRALRPILLERRTMTGREVMRLLRRAHRSRLRLRARLRGWLALRLRLGWLRLKRIGRKIRTY